MARTAVSARGHEGSFVGAVASALVAAVVATATVLAAVGAITGETHAPAPTAQAGPIDESLMIEARAGSALTALGYELEWDSSIRDAGAWRIR